MRREPRNRLALALHERLKIAAAIHDELAAGGGDAPTRKGIDQRQQFRAQVIRRRELLGHSGMPLLRQHLRHGFLPKTWVTKVRVRALVEADRADDPTLRKRDEIENPFRSLRRLREDNPLRSSRHGWLELWLSHWPSLWLVHDFNGRGLNRNDAVGARASRPLWPSA